MALKVSLTKPQSEFFASEDRFTAFVGGFGSGKSHALFTKMLADKIAHPKVDIGYFAPTYSLIRDIAHIRLQNMLDETKYTYRLNKADNVITINKKGRILFRTMDNPDRIVGFEIFKAYIDELDTLSLEMAENAWEKIIARVRQIDPNEPDHDNQIFVATTPEGYRFVYKKWGNNPSPSYRLIKAPTRSNPHLPQSYIDSLYESYPANLIEAYLEGEFVNLARRTVYSNFDRRHNDTDRIIEKEDKELHIGMDFNVHNMSATTHLLDKEEKKAWAVDEITELKDTPAMVDEINERYSEQFRTKEINIYPDASGKNPKSSDASKSDLKCLRDAGFKVHAKRKNPPIKDRVNSVNAMFLTGDNKRHYWINQEKCPQYVNALEQQTYDDNGKPLKNPNDNIDDLNDSGGYCIVWNFPIHRPKFQTAQTWTF